MPPQHVSNATILQELEEHNAFFDDMVDMIPAKLYIAGNTGDEGCNPKYRKGQNKASKEVRRAKIKLAKQAKFDPNLAESTRQAKIRIEQEQQQQEDDEDVPMEEEDEDEQSQKGKNTVKLPPSVAQNSVNETSGGNKSRIEALRAKLRAKIAEKQGNRPSGDGDASATISKRAARRAEKQRRIELAKKRNAGSTQTGKNKGPTVTLSKSLTEEELGGSKVNDMTDRSVKDDISGVDFGALTGLNDKSGNNYQDANKSLKNMGKKKSLERMLEEAESKRERLKQLKESGNQEDVQKAKNILWGDTLKAASGGQKKTDDPALLKKAIKRKAKKKEKSQEGWKARMKQTQEKMDEKQKIRAHNLSKRKEGGLAGANLSKKRINDDNDEADDGTKRPRLGPHSGKTRAGFEGKKQDFINKKGSKKTDSKQ